MNGSSPNTFHYIDSPTDLQALTDRLQQADRIALDTEADSLHHYFEKVCLIQLSVDDEDYILDPLAGLDMSRFLKVLAHKPLILHGADYDLRILRTSLDFRPKKPIFDTMIAAQLLGHTQQGLVALIERFFEVTLTKKGQKSNWARRPLTDKQLEYATADTHYLEPLARLLADELTRLGRLDWHTQTCVRMVKATAQDNHRNPDDAWRIKGISSLTRKELALVREIWQWRDQEARQADRPAFKILPNPNIITLAIWAVEHDGDDLDAGPKLPRHCVGQRREALRRAIRKGRRLPESQWPERRKRGPMPPAVPIRTKLAQILGNACADTARELGVEPYVIAPRASLMNIARDRPQTLTAIMESGSLMRWQAELLKPSIVPILRSVPDDGNENPK